MCIYSTYTTIQKFGVWNLFDQKLKKKKKTVMLWNITI